MSAQIDLLLDVIDRAYDRRSWHGTNLRGSIRRVDVVEAAWRPAPGRHNIWEIAVHAAYWKYVVRRRLLGEKRGSFPLKGSDFFERPVAGEGTSAWKADIALLDDMHASLRDAISALPARALGEKVGASKVDTLTMITGIAAHDLYHAGQIQLLKRLHRTA